MLDLNKAIKYLEHFSITTIDIMKRANFPWKSQQSKRLSIDKFSANYQYNGGKFNKENIEIQPTAGFAIITGFEDLEVIDIDLKVLHTAQEQRAFWNEFLNLLRDNILDFDEKFIIYKTQNAGFHILYKNTNIAGNSKLAKLKGHKEYIIETRGIGGYIVAYPENKVSKGSYFDVKYISDEDHETIISACKIYNYIDESNRIPTKEEVKINPVFSESEITPWADFNSKNDIFSVIQDDFKLVGNVSKHYLIKRHGSESAHSGYVYKDTGCMYLFTPNTIYPELKLISPFAAYTFKYHNGDYKAASSDLYKKGYGSRVKAEVDQLEKKLPKKKDTIVDEYILNTKDLEFPIDIFHKDFQYYILECKDKLDSNIDFMGVSLMWAMSVIIGNTIKVEVKKGWVENTSLWISVVGKAGLGKTPSINNILFPLQRINSREIKKYLSDLTEYNAYEALNKKEKADYPEIKKPIKKQFIANDITIEALVDLHQESDNSVGVFKDELAGWLKDMNKYRAGSDLEFWLSSWSGKSVNLNRITRPGSFVENPCIPVLGGIQPEIFNSFYTDENKANGFMDRMLISYPDAKIEEYNDNELSSDLIEWYKECIIFIYDNINLMTVRDEEMEITPIIARFSADAKKEWARIYNEFTNVQNSDLENEYLKSMYPKQKSYLPRFALIIHVFNSFCEDNIERFIVSKDSILKAEKLSKYFIANAKKIKIDSSEVADIKNLTKKTENNFDKIKVLHEDNPKFNRTKAAELIGVSVQYIRKVIAKIEEAR